MIVTSCTSLHYGINFIVAPELPIDAATALRFQSALAEGGLVFDRAARAERTISLQADREPLQVQVGSVGPQVSQILVIAPQPQRELTQFIRQVDEVIKAARKVWTQMRQSLARDATLRQLYPVTGKHAFQYLWETRLQQPEGSLEAFGRPVLGGGLRFVMPPVQPTGPAIELKIESFLRDPKMLFVETQFGWQFPVSIDEGLRPAPLLQEVLKFSTKNVVEFMATDSQEP